MDILKGRRLMNESAAVISEALCGAIIDNPSLGLLEFGNIVVRRDYTSINTVKIIGGGGAGHDPAYSGYVGKGMLTAAVHGTYLQAVFYKLIIVVNSKIIFILIY